MPISFHDPRAELGVPAQPYELYLTGDERRVFGFVSNGYPDASRLAAELELALRRDVPIIEGRYFKKETTADVLQGSLLDEVVNECDAVIALYGH